MKGDLAAITAIALALGIVCSLICYLVTNLSPGGMITPGWLALVLINEPVRLLPIGVIVIVTYLVVMLLERVVILYGKRLFATVVLVAVFLQVTAWLLLGASLPRFFGFSTLGIIVPGLIAYQLRRQPVGATLIATGTVTAIAYTFMVSGVLLRVLPGPEDIGALEGFSSSRTSPVSIAIAIAIGIVGLVSLAVRFRRVSRLILPVPAANGDPMGAGRSPDPLAYLGASEEPHASGDRPVMRDPKDLTVRGTEPGDPP
jgi:poly-gamma-glutamate biosynthesis protein PgsC/CapC